MTNINYNINFVVGRTGNKRTKAEPVLSTAVENVGFLAATNRQRNLQKNLRRDFEPIVERQLQKMARDISRMGVGFSGATSSPSGTLRIEGRVSQAMLSSAQPLSISTMTGQWASRSKAYMKYKFRKYRTRKWFQNTGRLKDQLGKVGTYRAAYGPLRVKFTPKNLSGSGTTSTLGRSRGGQSRNIQIGRLEVEPLRRLRGSDLPGLGSVASYNRGLMSPLADGIQKKLTGRPKDGKYRPVLEPFLTYYLTRKIPNAVFLKLEDSLL